MKRQYSVEEKIAFYSAKLEKLREQKEKKGVDHDADLDKRIAEVIRRMVSNYR